MYGVSRAIGNNVGKLLRRECRGSSRVVQRSVNKERYFCDRVGVFDRYGIATKVENSKMPQVPGCMTVYTVKQEGSGETVEKGNTVTVHATGVVKESSYKFWSTKDPGQKPFQFQAGVGSVIKGWDMGCLGMKKGEIRALEIPFDEGYGAGGFPAWKIPPHATLQFEIEILDIQK